jgi:hypothetical protein
MTQNFKENPNIDFVSRSEFWFSGKILEMLEIMGCVLRPWGGGRSQYERGP